MLPYDLTNNVRLTVLWLTHRTHPELDESFPARADPLGQESTQLPGVSAFGLCLYYVSTIWPIGIGS